MAVTLEKLSNKLSLFLNFVRSNPNLSTKEIAKGMGVTKNTALYYLNLLFVEGSITKEGNFWKPGQTTSPRSN